MLPFALHFLVPRAGETRETQKHFNRFKTGADWGINGMSTSSSTSLRSLRTSLRDEFISSHSSARFD